jgi:hypothetical protein
MPTTSICSSTSVGGTRGQVLEILLLLLLMLGAGLVFLPEFLKERTLDSPVETVSDFRRGMTALAVSTHNHEPRGRYYARANEPDPYVRRSHYTEQIDDRAEDFIPYPSNRGRMDMETRRNRVLALLLVIAISTAIMALVPNMKWIIPLHVVILVVLAGYIALSILLPHAQRRR